MFTTTFYKALVIEPIIVGEILIPWFGNTNGKKHRRVSFGRVHEGKNFLLTAPSITGSDTPVIANTIKFFKK